MKKKKKKRNRNSQLYKLLRVETVCHFGMNWMLKALSRWFLARSTVVRHINFWMWLTWWLNDTQLKGRFQFFRRSFFTHRELSEVVRRENVINVSAETSNRQSCIQNRLLTIPSTPLERKSTLINNFNSFKHLSQFYRNKTQVQRKRGKIKRLMAKSILSLTLVIKNEESQRFQVAFS